MRKKVLWGLCFAAGLCACAWAADWPSTGGNPQRDGWAQGETVLSKQNIADKKIQLLYSYKFDNQAKGLTDMSQPIVLSNIIGYQGFKQLIFIGGSSNAVYSLDADIGKLFFKTDLSPMDKTGGASLTALCPAGMTATLAMPGQSRPALRGGFAPPPAAARGRGEAAPGREGAAPGRAAAPARGAGGGGGFGRGGPAVFWAVSGDGYLRTLRQQDGNGTWIAPTKFLPANSDVSGLNVSDNVIYAATENNCGGNPNALYAALYTAPQLPAMPGEALVAPAKFDVVSFMTNGSGLSGPGGTAIASDGSMVYGQVAEGHGDVAGQYHDTVLALDPRTLEVKDYFTPSGSTPAIKKGILTPGVTPAVFEWQGKDVLVAGGRDGRIYLLDGSSLGGVNHHTPLYASAPVVEPDPHYGGDGIWGTFATWEDTANNARWLYAAIRGPATMQFAGNSGSARTGAIVAFKVVDDGGKPNLSPQWISRDMISPAGPVTANGLVFALSTGVTPRVAKDNGTPYTVAEQEQMAKPAVLYILDGATGQELLSSGSTAKSFSTSGIAVANGRVYFTTHDNTLYAYGLPEEH